MCQIECLCGSAVSPLLKLAAWLWSALSYPAFFIIWLCNFLKSLYNEFFISDICIEATISQLFIHLIKLAEPLKEVNRSKRSCVDSIHTASDAFVFLCPAKSLNMAQEIFRDASCDFGYLLRFVVNANLVLPCHRSSDSRKNLINFCNCPCVECIDRLTIKLLNESIHEESHILVKLKDADAILPFLCSHLVESVLKLTHLECLIGYMSGLGFKLLACFGLHV